MRAQLYVQVCKHMPACQRVSVRVLAHNVLPLCLGLARTIYIRCIHGIFGREITRCTVIYGAHRPRLFSTFFWELGFNKVRESSRTLKLFEGFDVQFWETEQPWYLRFWPTLIMLLTCECFQANNERVRPSGGGGRGGCVET
jgi:hypothetical protein